VEGGGYTVSSGGWQAEGIGEVYGSGFTIGVAILVDFPRVSDVRAPPRS
jgi:hypothetical protein